MMYMVSCALFLSYAACVTIMRTAVSHGVTPIAAIMLVG